MNSRERIKTTIAGEEADRCGFWLGNPDGQSWPAILDFFGMTEQEELRSTPTLACLEELGDVCRASDLWTCLEPGLIVSPSHEAILPTVSAAYLKAMVEAATGLPVG